MTKRHVVSPANLPSHPMRTATHGFVWYLGLHHFQAPDWAYGAVGVLWGILLLATGADLFLREDHKLWDDRGNRQ